jgi:hypothetical protein
MLMAATIPNRTVRSCEVLHRGELRRHLRTMLLASARRSRTAPPRRHAARLERGKPLYDIGDARARGRAIRHRP